MPAAARGEVGAGSEPVGADSWAGPTGRPAATSAVLAPLGRRGEDEAPLYSVHWTGMRLSQMGLPRRDECRLDDAIPFIAVPRGMGARPAAIPLVEEGLDGARDFLAHEALVRGPAPARRRRWHGPHAKHVPRVHGVCYPVLLRGRTATHGADVADIQDLNGRTNPSTAMLYAPPRLAGQQAEIARLRASEGDAAAGRRLAVPGSTATSSGTWCGSTTSRTKSCVTFLSAERPSTTGGEIA